MMPENIEAIWDEMDKLKRVNEALLKACELAVDWFDKGNPDNIREILKKAISKAKGGD